MLSHSLLTVNIHIVFKFIYRRTLENTWLIKKCLRSKEDLNLFSVLLSGKWFWITLDDTSDVLGWEITELTHLKINVSLDECFSL